MRKWSKVLCAAMALTMVVPTFGDTIATKEMNVEYLGNTSKVTAKVVKDRSLVGIREMGNVLGASVSYNSANKEINLNDSQVVMTVGLDTATINGQEVKLDMAPMVIESKAYLPLRTLIENLGSKVEYAGDTIKITADNEDVTQQETNNDEYGGIDTSAELNDSDKEALLKFVNDLNAKFDPIKSEYEAKLEAASTENKEAIAKEYSMAAKKLFTEICGLTDIDVELDSEDPGLAYENSKKIKVVELSDNTFNESIGIYLKSFADKLYYDIRDSLVEMDPYETSYYRTILLDFSIYEKAVNDITEKAIGTTVLK